MRLSWWPLWIVLFCCGPAAVQKAPVQPGGGLPVEVQGNQEISLSRLRAVISAGDMSSPATIAKTVTGLYYDFGFVNVRVKASQETQRILVEIQEGESFVFGEVRVDGPDRRSLPRPPFQAGDTFSSSKVKRYLAEIEAYYSKADRDVRVTPHTETDLKSKSVKLTVRIRDARGEVAVVQSQDACTPTPGIGNGEALVLRGDQEVILGPDQHYTFSRICVQDRAAIRICSRARIMLGGTASVVIGGRGISGFWNLPVRMFLTSQTTAKLYLLLKSRQGSVQAELAVPASKLVTYSTSDGRAPNPGNPPLRVSGKGRPVWVHARTFPACY